jgi:hypothetical protein
MPNRFTEAEISKLLKVSKEDILASTTDDVVHYADVFIAGSGPIA